MSTNKKQLEPDDFFYFSLPLRSPAANLKSMRFFLWVAIIGLIVVPFYLFDYAQEVMPLTGPLVLVYLLLALISLFSLFTLLLFKTKIYESMVYFMAGFFFLGLAYLLVIVSYTEFFMRSNEMEVFQTLDTSLIEMKKVVLLNRLLLVPLISFVFSIFFHIYAIKTGKTSKNYKRAQKFEKNSQAYNKLVPVISSAIFAVAFFGGMLHFTVGNVEFTMFILGSVLIAILCPSFMVMSYMKRKFPEVYLEKNIRK